MRTIDEIQDEMIAAKEADPNLSGLTNNSATAIWRLMFYIVAVAIWSLEKIVNISMKQQTEFIRQIKIHSLTWYSMYAKKFQFGDALPWGEVEYDPIDTDKQIVKFASAQKIPGGLVIKVAKEVNGNLEQLSTSGPDEVTPLEDYIFRISAAGDNISIRNEPADDLSIQMQVFYDPLVLDSQGQLLGTTTKPVEEALDAYLKGIDFDGMLVEQDLVDALQVVEGVEIINVQRLETKYGHLSYMPVPPEGVNPYSGYVRVDQSVIIYTAH